MSFGGVGPTELRILLAIGTIALRNDPHVYLGAFGRVPLFDFGGVIAIAGLLGTFVVSVTQNARLLARLEPRRNVQHSGRSDSRGQTPALFVG
jgi:hypothetical protein